MPHRILSVVRRLLVLGALLSCALPAGAQQAKHGVRGKVDGDSTSFIVDRLPPGLARATLRTTDRRVALLLVDTAVVLQLTDRGMEKLFEGDTTTHSVGGAFFARMLRAGIAELLDHGIAYRLSALRRAYADGGRLVLEDLEGKHVFESTELNGRHPMEEFAPDEAERFAAAVQRAIVARR
jgi:hypothetical protein